MLGLWLYGDAPSDMASGRPCPCATGTTLSSFKKGIGDDGMSLPVGMPDIQAEMPQRLVDRLE